MIVAHRDYYHNGAALFNLHGKCANKRERYLCAPDALAANCGLLVGWIQRLGMLLPLKCILLHPYTICEYVFLFILKKTHKIRAYI